MLSSNRNSAVDALKGVMILVIVLHHLVLIPFLHHGAMAVDMFFMIAGYYLANHFHTKGGTAAQYTWRRIKGVYLPYLLALLLATVLDFKRLLSFQGFEGFMETYAPYVAFLTLTEELGFIDHWPVVLVGGWFLSVLIISGFLLYSLLEYNEKKTAKVILPFIVLIGFTFFFSQGPSTGNFSVIGAISIPLLRGFLEMGLGVFIFYIISENQEALSQKKTFITVISLVSFAIFIALLFVKKHFDSYIIILFPLILTGFFIPDPPIKRLYDRCPTKILAWLGALSLEIYVIHQPAIHIVHSSFKFMGLYVSPAVKVIACVAFSIFAAFLLRLICRYVRVQTTKETR